MLKDFKAKDLIALLVIVMLGIFKLTGHNGTLDVSFAIIIGYYFARREDAQIMIHDPTLKAGVPLVLTTKDKIQEPM